jgi:hypothetical protein
VFTKARDMSATAGIRGLRGSGAVWMPELLSQAM